MTSETLKREDWLQTARVVLAWIRTDTANSDVEPGEDGREDLLTESIIERTADALMTYIEAARKRAALCEPEWMRIEDMPEEWKDGRRVLLGNEHGTWLGYYCPVYQSGYRPTNPWTSLMLNHRDMKKPYNIVPTHVRLPPDPPKGE